MTATLALTLGHPRQTRVKAVDGRVLWRTPLRGTTAHSDEGYCYWCLERKRLQLYTWGGPPASTAALSLGAHGYCTLHCWGQDVKFFFPVPRALQ